MEQNQYTLGKKISNKYAQVFTSITVNEYIFGIFMDLTEKVYISIDTEGHSNMPKPFCWQLSVEIGDIYFLI